MDTWQRYISPESADLPMPILYELYLGTGMLSVAFTYLIVSRVFPAGGDGDGGVKIGNVLIGVFVVLSVPAIALISAYALGINLLRIDP